MKVAAIGDSLTAFVNGAKLVEVKMDAHGTATKFGVLDHSKDGSQPHWSDFKVVAP
jgi:hypothetical protein